MTNSKSPNKTSFAFMKTHPAHWIAQGFGSGLSPVMPGTAGTLFAWIVFAFFTITCPTFFTQTTWLIISVLGFILGIWVCQKTGDDLNAPDHGSMVWDEIIAMWLILALFMPLSWSAQLLAFILFRIFDMVKPFPISYFDRRVKGGFGVMLDDIIAAIFAIIVLLLINRLVWPLALFP